MPPPLCRGADGFDGSQVLCIFNPNLASAGKPAQGKFEGRCVLCHNEELRRRCASQRLLKLLGYHMYMLRCANPDAYALALRRIPADHQGDVEDLVNEYSQPARKKSSVKPKPEAADVDDSDYASSGTEQEDSREEKINNDGELLAEKNIMAESGQPAAEPTAETMAEAMSSAAEPTTKADVVAAAQPMAGTATAAMEAEPCGELLVMAEENSQQAGALTAQTPGKATATTISKIAIPESGQADAGPVATAAAGATAVDMAAGAAAAKIVTVAAIDASAKTTTGLTDHRQDLLGPPKRCRLWAELRPHAQAAVEITEHDDPVAKAAETSGAADASAAQASGKLAEEEETQAAAFGEAMAMAMAVVPGNVTAQMATGSSKVYDEKQKGLEMNPMGGHLTGEAADMAIFEAAVADVGSSNNISTMCPAMMGSAGTVATQDAAAVAKILAAAPEDCNRLLMPKKREADVADLATGKRAKRTSGTMSSTCCTTASPDAQLDNPARASNIKEFVKYGCHVLSWMSQAKTGIAEDCLQELRALLSQEILETPQDLKTDIEVLFSASGDLQSRRRVLVKLIRWARDFTAQTQGHGIAASSGMQRSIQH